MSKVWKSSKRDLQEWGEKGRIWATREFSIETIGAKWETLFDAMPITDWSSVDLTPKPKNDTFPMPAGGDDIQFITTLYTEILKMNEPVHGDGHKHWQQKLKDGMKREDIYAYFLSVARDDNVKNGAKQNDFWDLIDKTTGRKRALLVVKESAGDCLLMTQLFESFHREYKDHDLYVASDPKFADIFAGNPHVFRRLDFIPAMTQEMAMAGAGHNDPYFHVVLLPTIPTQQVLGYLNSTTASLTPHLRLA
jgi:hypothetical protein